MCDMRYIHIPAINDMEVASRSLKVLIVQRLRSSKRFSHISITHSPKSRVIKFEDGSRSFKGLGIYLAAIVE